MEKIKSEWKYAFVSTIIFGFIAHGYKMANSLINHDVLWNMAGYGSGAKFGRPIASLTNLISTYYGDLPWINGILAIIYIALSMVAVTEIFNIKDKKKIVIYSALAVTGPGIISMFAYIHCTDTYLIGVLCASLTILLYKKISKSILKILCSGFLLAITLGIYQSYITYVIILVILLLIQDIFNGISNRMFFKNILSYLCMGVTGVCIYGILVKLALILEQRELTDYMGMSTVGRMSSLDIVEAIRKMYQSFCYYFFLNFESLSIYAIVNLIIFCVGGLFFGHVIILKKIYKKKLQTLFIVICVFALPAICYPLYVLSSGVTYHRLMEVSLFLVYIGVMLFMEFGCAGDEHKTRWHKYGEKVFCFSMCLLVYINILSANVAYQEMTQGNKYTFNLLNRIIYDIEQVSEEAETNKIMIVGNIIPKAQLYSYDGYPDITGVTNGNIIFEEYHYVKMFEWYWGYDFEIVDISMKDTIRAKEEFYEMGVWPQKNSVKVINDIIVVKLSD